MSDARLPTPLFPIAAISRFGKTVNGADQIVDPNRQSTTIRMRELALSAASKFHFAIGRVAMKVNLRFVGFAMAYFAACSASATSTGLSQDQPILPVTVNAFWQSVSLPGTTVTVIRGDESVFQPVGGTFLSDRWYGNGWISNLDGWNNQAVTGLSIVVSGSDITHVTAPDSFSGLTLMTGGHIVESNFGSGSSFTFAPGVHAFEVVGLPTSFRPGVAAPASVLPLQLGFNWVSTSIPGMAWRTISIVPEVDTWLLLSIGLLVVGVVFDRSEPR